jgi:CheY-like chemotaxis protein
MEIWTRPDKERSAGKKKILLIDDDDDICYFAKKYLENTGQLEVIVENRGEDGIKRALEQKPDLILLDIMMPGIDGLAVLARLKDNPETSLIPVIMLTAKGETDSILKAQKSFTTDYIIKPFEPKKLLDLIVKYLDIKIILEKL